VCEGLKVVQLSVSRELPPIHYFQVTIVHIPSVLDQESRRRSGIAYSSNTPHRLGLIVLG
jgi:hypothetical protein